MLLVCVLTLRWFSPPFVLYCNKKTPRRTFIIPLPGIEPGGMPFTNGTELRIEKECSGMTVAWTFSISTHSTILIIARTFPNCFLIFSAFFPVFKLEVVELGHSLPKQPIAYPGRPRSDFLPLDRLLDTGRYRQSPLGPSPLPVFGRLRSVRVRSPVVHSRMNQSPV